LTAIPAGALLLLDAGFTNFHQFLLLSTLTPQITFIIPTKSNLVYAVKRCFLKTSQVHDYWVWVGTGEERQLLAPLGQTLSSGSLVRVSNQWVEPRFLARPLPRRPV
jgi:hypothetical protein